MTASDAVGAALDPTSAADAILAANAARFEGLVADAERRGAAGDREGAAGAARTAAADAWFNHPGVHASPRLEGLLRGVASRGGRSGTPRRRPPRTGGRERVLHVLTEAYASGGHTRLVERLVTADAARRHDIVIILQGAGPVPAWLADAAEASGGRLIRLASGGLLERAGTLRGLATDHDLVLVYPHPNDVVTDLALGDPASRPPVAALNHADHCFWLGAGTWDLVVNMRASGESLTRRRRGVPATRSTILAAPLPERSRTMTRDEAKALHGLGPDEILLLSVGSDWKFGAGGWPQGPTFAEVLAPIVARDRRLRLFAFGPKPFGPWADAARLTGGRMQALGTRSDVALYQQAADLYLDPFPTGSTYSLLEAGSLGVPVLTFNQWPEEAATLAVDSPGISDARIVVRDRDAYEAAVMRLVDDRAGREALGGQLAADITAAHTGDGWRDALERVLDRMPAAWSEHVDAGSDLDPELGVPAFGAHDRALVSAPMCATAVPATVVTHLPIAFARARPDPGPAAPPAPSLQEDSHDA